MVSKGVRSKLEQFFNPGPENFQKTSRDIEDPIDLYDHTKQFFDKSKDAQNIEIGERKIKGDIDIDDLVYGGKKVSRKDLDHSSDDYDQEDNSDEIEDDIEEE